MSLVLGIYMVEERIGYCDIYILFFFKINWKKYRYVLSVFVICFFLCLEFISVYVDMKVDRVGDIK